MTTDNNSEKITEEAITNNSVNAENNGTDSKKTKNELMKSDISVIKKRSAVKTDISDIIIFFLTIFTVYDAFYIFLNLADSYLISITHFVFTALVTVILIIKERRFPKKAIFPAVLLLLVTASYSLFYFDPFLRHLFSLYIFGYYICTLTDTEGFPPRAVADVFRQLRSLFLLPVKKVFLPYKSLSLNKNNPQFRKITGILTGIILGIPVFAVCAFLLISGDTAFHDVFFDLFGWFFDLFDSITENIGSHIECAIATLIFAPFVYSFIFTSKHKLTKTEKEHISTENRIKRLKFMSSSVLLGFYSVISICYVIFLFSQFKYLFSAFSKTGANGYSLSEYARDGFFEMSAVAIINFALIAAGVLFTKRNSKEELPKTYKIFSVFFCLFTILLIIIAIMKMAHYVTGLGFTQKRLAVLLADIVMLITFICILIKQFRKHFPYLRIVSTAALASMCLFLTVGTDAFIAEFNTEMYLSGKHSSIDIYTISELGSDYIKMLNLEKLADDDNEETAASAKREMYSLYLQTDYTSDTIDTIDEKLFIDYCDKNTEKLNSYSQYADYYVKERFMKKEVDYICSYCYIKVSVPETFVSFELSNSLANAVISYDDKTVFDEGDIISIYDWVYSKDQGLFAKVKATDINGKCFIFDIRLDDEITTEDATKTLKTEPDQFDFEIICDESGNYQIIKTEY